MKRNMKRCSILLILAMLISSLALAHRNMKNIKKGVIHPVKCDKGHGDHHSLKETIRCGKKSGFYIKSPARRYDIRKKDTRLVLRFLGKHKTVKVKAQLVIDLRKKEVELWKITKLRKRN